jgi:hypothetical protein
MHVSKTPMYKAVKAKVKDKAVLKTIRDNLQIVLDMHDPDTFHVGYDYADELSGCFIFNESPQGHEFWWDLCEKYDI